MIQILGLSKSYGDRQAISNLNFMIKKGEVVGFLGPNGAGKSTTMKIITGFMPSTSGQVLIDGDDIFAEPLKTKSKIGYLPEQPPVYTDMRVNDYLVYVCRLKKVAKQSIEQYVDEALHQTQLLDVKGRLIQNLSKGYRQRVGLAGALLARPEILILDEPTVGLDPNQVLEFRKLILSLKGKQTILLSTHVLSEVQATCDRVIIIDKGEILAEETLSQVMVNVGHKTRYSVQVLRKSDELIQTLKLQDGVHNVVADTNHRINIIFNSEVLPVERIAQVVVSSGAGLVGLSPMSSAVENLFSRVTQNNEVRA